jgi:hypothetical protein
MEMGYRDIQARKVKPYATQEQIDMGNMKADLATFTFFLVLFAVFISQTDWLSVPLVF